MIGLFNASSVFSLEALNDLSEYAESIYTPVVDPDYPVGGIPSGEGTGVYTYTGDLNEYIKPYVDQYYTHELTATDETLILENLHISQDNPSGGDYVAVRGVEGANQTLIVRGCKWYNKDGLGMYIKGVDNIIIEGNYWDLTLKPFTVYWVKNITIRYNKFRNHAVGTYNGSVGHHVFAINGGNDDGLRTVDSLEIAYNLVDRSDAPHIQYDLVPRNWEGTAWDELITPETFTATSGQTQFTLESYPLYGVTIVVNSSTLDPSLYNVSGLIVTFTPSLNSGDSVSINYDPEVHSVDRNETALASDYINTRWLTMTQGNIGRIHNNVQLGSEYIGECQSGCGFILDARSYDIELKRNVSINATNTSFGSANSKGTWIENFGGYTNKANRNLSQAYRADMTDPVAGTILKHGVRFVGITWYSGHSCDASSEREGPHSLIGNMGGRLSTDDINISSVGVIQSSVSSLEVTEDGYNTVSGNSFQWSTNPIYPRENAVDCGVISWSSYFDLTNTTDVGAPSAPTAVELYDMACGLPYVAGMATNNAMFNKWGTANNHEMYFDETRTL